MLLDRLRADVDLTFPSDPSCAANVLLTMPNSGAPVVWIKRKLGDPANVVPVFFVATDSKDLLLSLGICERSGGLASLEHTVSGPNTGRYLVIPYLFDRFDDHRRFIECVTAALLAAAEETSLAWFQEDCWLLLSYGGYTYEASLVDGALKVERGNPLGLAPNHLVIYLGPFSESLPPEFAQSWEKYQRECRGSHVPGSGHPLETLERGVFEDLAHPRGDAPSPLEGLASSAVKAPVTLGQPNLKFGLGPVGYGASIWIDRDDVRIDGLPPDQSALRHIGANVAAALDYSLLRRATSFVLTPPDR